MSSESLIPNPGSDEAAKRGCICPRIDNHYGKGARDDGAKYGWYTVPSCPLHGRIGSMTKAGHRLPICIRYQKIYPDAIPPKQQTAGAVGMDIFAYVFDEESSLSRRDALCLYSKQICLVETGIRIAVPDGYELQIRPRSGLALNHGITVLNTPGTVDPDYRGPLKIILINLSACDYIIYHGDRIAQAVLKPIIQNPIHWIEDEDFDVGETKRGEGGGGSTGV